MKNKAFLLISILGVCLASCYPYKIEITDIEELRKTMIAIEHTIKKIEKPPYFQNSKHIVPLFVFKEDHISMGYTMLHFESKDSIVNRAWNANWQECADTAIYMPGLSLEEWDSLKTNLFKLRDYGIKNNGAAFYNDGVIQFFYYAYYYPPNFEYRDVVYLAFLSQEQIKQEDFDRRFRITIHKDDLYMFHLR